MTRRTAPEWSQEDKNEVLAYARNGVSYREIAQLTGVPRATIGRWAKAAGFSPERQPSPETIEAIKKDSLEKRQLKLARLLDEIDAGIDRLSREPNSMGFRNVSQGIANLTKAYSEIKRYAPDNSAEEAKSLLTSVLDVLTVQSQELPAFNDHMTADGVLVLAGENEAMARERVAREAQQ